MCFRYAPPRCNSVRLPSLAYCSLDKGVAYTKGGGDLFGMVRFVFLKLSETPSIPKP